LYDLWISNDRMIGPISKNEVLKIRNKYYLRFFCKNDICMQYKPGYNYIKIPDVNGNEIEYIIDMCSRSDIESNNCVTVRYCNKDSECLYNECFIRPDLSKQYGHATGICTFTNNTEISHCDVIYSPTRWFKSYSGYMYCGKGYEISCKTNLECSSQSCSNGKFSWQYVNGPQEGEGLTYGVVYLGIIVIIGIIISCVCCCCIAFKNRKRNKMQYLE